MTNKGFKMPIELVTKKDVVRIADMYSKLYSHVYKRPDNVRKREKLIAYVEVRLNRKGYFIYKAVVRNKIVGTISSKLLSSKRGFTLSKIGGSPPTMIVSEPALAPTSPPDTGASR